MVRFVAPPIYRDFNRVKGSVKPICIGQVEGRSDILMVWALIGHFFARPVFQTIRYG